MNVIAYITEEVTRQGHDVTTLDGIERVGWMLNAWAYALRQGDRRPDLNDALTIARMVEPEKNADGIRTCGVRVGRNACPQPELVPRMMEGLFDHGGGLSPIEFYKAYELCHPFVDGNGRSGKVLLNWLNGTLLDPIFPPRDLFGTPIGNP